MMLSHFGAMNLRNALEGLTPIERKELVKAIVALNRSLTVTQGEGWLEHATGNELPYDVYSTAVGHVAPDEQGVMRSTLTS